MKTIKIKIINCDSQKSWYVNKIGEIFNVTPVEKVKDTNGDWRYVYYIVEGGGKGIEVYNCITISREKKLKRILGFH